MYKKILKVSTPDNKPVVIKVNYSGGVATITSGFYESIKKDNPDFSKDGKIRIIVERDNYQAVIIKLESYFEEGTLLHSISHIKETPIM